MVSGEPKATSAVRAAIGADVRGARTPEDVVDAALELGVLGWVREGDDGELLIHAEGTEGTVSGLLDTLGLGDGDGVETVRVEGHEQFAIRGVPAGRFEVRRKLEGRRGFELRLEVDGGLRAWALPKGPSMDPAAKRMAFEAAVTGEQAGDADEVWDAGDYEQGGRVPWPEAIEHGHAVFVLHGERLAGGFALQRIRADPRPQWLLVKRKDDEARPGSDVVAEAEAEAEPGA